MTPRAIPASREETKVFLSQTASVTAAMLGIDARQPRAAPVLPECQGQAARDCLAAGDTEGAEAQPELGQCG